MLTKLCMNALYIVSICMFLNSRFAGLLECWTTCADSQIPPTSSIMLIRRCSKAKGYGYFIIPASSVRILRVDCNECQKPTLVVSNLDICSRLIHVYSNYWSFYWSWMRKSSRTAHQVLVTYLSSWIWSMIICPALTRTVVKSLDCMLLWLAGTSRLSESSHSFCVHLFGLQSCNAYKGCWVDICHSHWKQVMRSLDWANLSLCFGVLVQECQTSRWMFFCLDV